MTTDLIKLAREALEDDKKAHSGSDTREPLLAAGVMALLADNVALLEMVQTLCDERDAARAEVERLRAQVRAREALEDETTP
jgi:hypothetical protein